MKYWIVFGYDSWNNCDDQTTNCELISCKTEEEAIEIFKSIRVADGFKEYADKSLLDKRIHIQTYDAQLYTAKSAIEYVKKIKRERREKIKAAKEVAKKVEIETIITSNSDEDIVIDFD